MNRETAGLLPLVSSLALILGTFGCAQRDLLVERRDLKLPVKIAFCNADGLSEERAADFRSLIRTRHHDFAFFRGPLFPELKDHEQWSWIECRRPSYGHTRPSKPWPSGVDVHEFGPVHVVVLETTEPVEENSEIYEWLVQDLSMTKSPWKIVLMTHSVFLPDFQPDHYALAYLFERAGVSLVIASGRPYYMRTYPIGMFPERGVRHIVLPDGPDAEPAEPAGATWISHTRDEPLYGTLAASEAELSWRTYDRRGRLLDACNLGSKLGPTSATRTVTIHDIRAARRDARKERQQ